MPTDRSSPERIAGLEDHLGYWLRFASNSVSASFGRKLAAHEISVAEWVTLRLVHGRDAAATLLARQMGMTRGAISKIVSRLQHRGLLERKAAPDDQRAQVLRLTAKGAKLLPVLASLADANDGEFFGQLSLDDRRALERILRGIIRHGDLKTIPVD